MRHREEGATAEAITRNSADRVSTGAEGAATDNAAEAREPAKTTAKVIRALRRAKRVVLQ